MISGFVRFFNASYEFNNGGEVVHMLFSFLPTSEQAYTPGLQTLPPIITIDAQDGVEPPTFRKGLPGLLPSADALST